MVVISLFFISFDVRGLPLDGREQGDAREEVTQLRRELESAKQRGDIYEKEVITWHKWRAEQPWLAEIQSYEKQVTRMHNELNEFSKACAYFADLDRLYVSMEKQDPPRGRPEITPIFWNHIKEVADAYNNRRIG